MQTHGFQNLCHHYLKTILREDIGQIIPARAVVEDSHPSTVTAQSHE